MAKPVDNLVKTGQMSICYGSKDRFTEAQALAERTCAAYGLLARMRFNDLYQCRMNTPHRAIFQCYDPEMTNKLGEYINPFSETEVRAWQERTGGKKEAAVISLKTPEGWRWLVPLSLLTRFEPTLQGKPPANPPGVWVDG